MVDDGNDNNLSLGERIWEGVKGAGKAIEGFFGTQGLAFMGALALGSWAAYKAKIGKIFNIAVKSYFLYQGSKLTYTGAKDFINAETKYEAKNAAATATTGVIMLYGTLKGIKRDTKNYKAQKAEFRARVAEARSLLEMGEDEVLTETTLKEAYRKAALKHHPDRGGSEGAMAETSKAYKFLSKNLNKAQKVNISALDKVTQEQSETTTSPIKYKTRGIDLSKLDKNKTYIGMQYGRRNMIARQIVKYTSKYCPNSDVPAHVFALSYRNGEWWVHESHIVENEQLGLVKGSHKLRITDWNKLGKNSIAETDIYEAKFNVEALDENAGQPYGSGDAFKHVLASIFDRNGKQSDSPGLLCSEYLAIGLEEVCDFYQLPPWCITPAHFKDYMVKHGAEQLN